MYRNFARVHKTIVGRVEETRKRPFSTQKITCNPKTQYKIPVHLCWMQEQTSVSARAGESEAARIVFFGRMLGSFPPTVAGRLLLSALTAAIEWPGIDLWR